MDTQPVILNNKGFFWEAADLALKAYHLAPDNAVRANDSLL